MPRPDSREPLTPRTPVRILPLGDAALSVEFGAQIDLATNERVRLLHQSLLQQPLPGVVETVPTYRSLMVVYRPETIGWEAISKELTDRVSALSGEDETPPETVDIPVLYGGEYGPDLAFVAKHAGLSEEEVVRIHSAGQYRVYMLGFLPGFPYLGGMDPRIAAPRLPSPRAEIAAGSVGIAGEQTGIYPLASPGGWQLIGRTPLPLYAPERSPSILLKAGQNLRFYSITQEEYDDISQREATYGHSG